MFVPVHVLCWLIFAFSVMFSRPGEWFFDQSKEVCTRQIVLLLVFMTVFYLNLYVLMPRFFLKRKTMAYVVIVLAIIVGAVYLNNLTAALMYDHVGNRQGHIHGTHAFRGRRHFDTFVPGMIALMIGLGITIRMIQKWQQETVLRQQLEQEKISTELAMLKAQINPHFFFNTLNTIYSYTLSDGDVARSAIANLSRMMRYVLYEAETAQTPLNKEIEFIREYINLMKLRITSKTAVNFMVQYTGSHVMIAPMLFLPFVENAFKHGVSNAEEGFINIGITGTDSTVELTVTNTIHETRSADEGNSSGIGILNTQRRLELLYPGKYSLLAAPQGEKEYRVILKLFL